MILMQKDVVQKSTPSVVRDGWALGSVKVGEEISTIESELKVAIDADLERLKVVPYITGKADVG